MTAAHSKVASINRTIGQLESPYNPAPSDRHRQYETHSFVIPLRVFGTGIKGHDVCRHVSSPASQPLAFLRMVQELENVGKSLETQYGELAKLRNQFTMGEIDQDGSTKLLG